MNVPRLLVSFLTTGGLNLATVESCTAGLIASSLAEDRKGSMSGGRLRNIFCPLEKPGFWACSPQLHVFGDSPGSRQP
ncbi:CinA family protein [Paraburkholderia hospita]|uniref:CinA family protein n=1 Tax=Paraburkholderia hospita TaxID=169430 RepID=UPI0039BE63F8